MKQIVIGVLLLMLLAACQQDEKPAESYVLGEVIYENSFDDPTSWETFGAPNTQFGISDGVYNAISAGGGYIPVVNNVRHSNVVIEATVALISGGESSIYGIMCRAQAANPSVAYYFLLTGGGQFGMRIGESGRIREFVEWSAHPAIKTGQASNTLRAVCVDGYFAFYINDRFVAEARQDWLTEGSMGLVVSAPEQVGVSAQFDDVTIWEASLAEE